MSETVNCAFFNPAECSTESLNAMGYVLDQLDTMAGILDTKGKVLFVNRAALKNIGAAIDQVKGVSFRESPWRNHSLEAKKITDEMIARALAGESSLIEDVVIDLSGRAIPTLFSISPARDVKGEIIALIPEGKIISNLKNLQNRLEKERWGTQQWIDSMGAFVAKCDPKGKIISCNQPFLAMSGMEPNEISDYYICDIVSRLGHSSKSQRRLREAVLRAGEGEKSSIEVDLTIAKKAHSTFLFSVSPILNAAGHISFVALEITNISEQVRLRELMLAKEKEYSGRLEREVSEVTKTLRETEQFNKNIIDSTPLGIIYLDENDRLLFANPEMEQKLETSGISRDCIKGKKLAELGIFPASSIWRKITDGQEWKVTPRQMKMLLFCNGKEDLQFDIHAAPLKSSTEGIKKGTILIMDDVTERNRLEEEVLKTRIQSEKMGSLELLISGVAHELNNPLTSITGCAEYLVENANLSKEPDEAARIIVSDARRAGKIVKNLLAFARQSASEETTVNLNEVTTNIVAIRIHELRHRGIRAFLDLDRNIQPVEADVTQMQQVVINLIGNAVDAIEESGVGDLITIRTHVEGNWVVMEVEDNGPGIPEEYVSKIFDPFFTTKQPGKGTGLGLSIAYGIIQKHGGTIVVDTSPNSGTRFIIRLPLFVSLWHQQSGNLPSPTWIPSKVLVVDDETNIRLTLSRYLSALGCGVDTAGSGNEALDKIKNRVYDLLLIDIKMSKMSGLELYEKLHAERPELAKRSVFMTGISGQETDDIIKTTGVPLLQKPFTRKDMLEFFSQLQPRFSMQLTGRSIN